jgi:hypothetical protein
LSSIVTLDGNSGAADRVPYIFGVGAADKQPYVQTIHSSQCWDGGGNTTYRCTHWGLIKPLPNPAGVQFKTLTAALGDGGLLPQVIGLGASDGLPYLMWQNHRAGDHGWHWAGQLPNPLGLRFNAAMAHYEPYGKHLQLLLLGADGLPYLLWQSPSGMWHWGGKLPNPKTFYGGIQFSALAAGLGNAECMIPGLVERKWGRNLQVILLGVDGLPYLIWQSCQKGTWHWYGKLPVQ